MFLDLFEGIISVFILGLEFVTIFLLPIGIPLISLIKCIKLKIISRPIKKVLLYGLSLEVIALMIIVLMFYFNMEDFNYILLIIFLCGGFSFFLILLFLVPVILYLKTKKRQEKTGDG